MVAVWGFVDFVGHFAGYDGKSFRSSLCKRYYYGFSTKQIIHSLLLVLIVCLFNFVVGSL